MSLNKFRFKRIIVAFTLIFGLHIVNTQEVFAAEYNEVSNETQELIDNTLAEFPELEQHIDNIYSLYKSSSLSESEFNTLIEESIDSSIKQINKSKNDLEEAQRHMDKQTISEITEDNTFNKTKAVGADFARNNYLLGVDLVTRKGHIQTAKYMKHAIVPEDKVGTSWTPGAYIHHNDGWASVAATDLDLNAHFIEEFEHNAYTLGKSHFNISSDTFRYKYGDLHTALNKVKYSITFVKQSNGAFKASYFISDTFDFAWNNYNNIAVDFGNNYAYAMQQLGLIKPFTISISYIMG